MGVFAGTVPLLGGSVNDGTIAGSFCFNVNDTPTNTNWNNGASPSLIDKFSIMPYQFLARTAKIRL